MMAHSAKKMRWGVKLLTALVLTGCMVGPDFLPPAVETPTDYRFDAGEAAVEVNLKWWELFKDPILNELITTALVNNRDVQIAASRIEEARAVLGFVGADRHPSFFIEGDAATGNFLTRTKSNSTDQSGFIGPTLNWEIDFWGKFRRATESAKAELLASEYAHRTVQLSLITEVVSTYNRLLDFHQRLQISRNTLKSRLKTLDIIQQRFDKGIVSELDLNQAQIQKEIAAASIPLFERQVAQTENALSTLIGQLPTEIPIGKGLKYQVTPPEIPVGLPSTLLERRPDIAEAMYLLEAQTEQIGIAEALRFPAFSLNGLVGVAGSDISGNTTDGGVWRAGAGLFGPIYQFGKNLRRVEIEEARARQTLYFYENTVLIAFREVEDALVQIDTFSRQSNAVSRQVAAARNANVLSLDRYDQGVTSYLEVLETERQYFSAELEYSQLYQEHLNSYVRLYKALGGGWMTPEEMQSAK
jgi:multidrug efflux system outer membrane protein